MEESTGPKPAEGTPQDEGKQLADTIASLQLIESLLEGDDKGKVPEISFELPLREVIKLLPEGTIISPSEMDPDKRITITVDQLYKQLAKGKVTASVAQLVFGIAADMVKPEAFDDDQTLISIPLPTVVSALDPELLRSRTAQKTRVYATDNLPDPFKSVPQPEAKPKEEPGPAADSTAETPTPEPETVAESQPEPPSVEAAPAAPEPAKQPEVPATPEPEAETETPEEPETVTEPTPVVPATPAPEPVKQPEVPATAEPVAEAETPEEPEPVTEPTPVVAATPAPEPVKQPEVRATPQPVAQSQKSEEPETVTGPPPEQLRPAAIAKETVSPPVATPSPQKPVEPEEAKRPQVPAAEPAELERLGGVNLNVATANELLTLDGMTPAIAQAIITHRTQHGSFSDVFSLHDVGRVGRKTFKSITGMNYNPRRTHRREKLAKLLKLPASSVSHLPTIVKAMVERTGFAGCILSDDDGFVLAQSGADEIAENFSATVPRTMQQVRENMSIANISGVDLVSIGVEDRMITVVASGNIFITYVQKSKRLTKGQVSLAERIGEELAWLLSHRGYVGQ